jgi:hypothetical protein
MRYWEFLDHIVSFDESFLYLDPVGKLYTHIQGGPTRILALASISGLHLEETVGREPGYLHVGHADGYSSLAIGFSRPGNAQAAELVEELVTRSPEIVVGPVSGMAWVDVVRNSRLASIKKDVAGVIQPPTLEALEALAHRQAEFSAIKRQDKEAALARARDEKMKTSAEAAERKERAKEEKTLNAQLKAQEKVRAQQEKDQEKVRAQQEKDQEKVRAKQEKAEAKDTAKIESARVLAEFTEQYGDIAADERFKSKRIVLLRNGYVTFASNFNFAHPCKFKNAPEKLVGLEAEIATQKKTGIGRAAAAVLTSGANLLYVPNMRGNLYLTILTEHNTYSWREDVPSATFVKALNVLQTVSRAILAQQQPEQWSDVIGRAQHDISEQLSRLSDLHDRGALSLEEFEAAKTKLIGL